MVNNILSVVARHVNLLRAVWSLNSDEVDVSALLRFVDSRVDVRVMLVKDRSGVFLQIFQRGADDPDYTIKVSK